MSRAMTHDAASAPRATSRHDPTVRTAHQAHWILYLGYIALPLIAGLDKFFDLLVTWDMYLAPVVPRMLPISAETFMLLVGVVEVVAGLLVAFAPGIGGFVVAAWLWGIIVNLLLIPGYYDIALRDLGLSLGALTVALLSREFGGPPWRRA